MAKTVKVNLREELPFDIKEVWRVVVQDFQDCWWRSDISAVEASGEDSFIEYTKDGYETKFTVTERQPYERWEFDMENGNMKGRWTGLFYGSDGKTTVDFTEEVSVKKFYMRPFAGRYLKRQQTRYIEDLKKALNGEGTDWK